MSLKSEYHQAYSALRWESTYDPGWDYWYRHYPHFDEMRDIKRELSQTPCLALGAAYKSYFFERERGDPLQKIGRYLDMQADRKRQAQTVKAYRYKIVGIEYVDGRVENFEKRNT